MLSRLDLLDLFLGSAGGQASYRVNVSDAEGKPTDQFQLKKIRLVIKIKRKYAKQTQKGPVKKDPGKKSPVKRGPGEKTL